MTEDEFRAWWIDYWAKQGLDPDILSRIYDAFKPAIDSLGTTRVRDKLRFIRSKLRSVS
jgi:beta-xylosidase